jgi:hypothetical protein
MFLCVITCIEGLAAVLQGQCPEIAELINMNYVRTLCRILFTCDIDEGDKKSVYSPCVRVNTLYIRKIHLMHACLLLLVVLFT